MNKQGKRNITISIFVIMIAALFVIGTDASGLVLGERGDGIIPDGGDFCPPGDCCTASGGLGCNDPECTDIVCAIDSWCCDVAWDDICADEAIQYCAICGGSFCGDGIINGDEECDGDDFGGLDCSDVGEYIYGDLICNEFCEFDTSECDYDDNNPSVRIIQPNQPTYYQGEVYVLSEVTDVHPGSGIKNVTVQFAEDGNWWTEFFGMDNNPLSSPYWEYYWPSLDDTCTQYATAYVLAEDYAGNTDNDVATFGIDNQDPVTTKHVSEPNEPFGDGNYYVTPDTEFSFTAQDIWEDCGSGVDETYYSVNEGDFQVYTGPFSLQPGCGQTIEYYSVDNVGNVEDTHLEVDHVDDLPPITNKTFDGPTYGENDYYLTKGTLVILSAEDQSPDGNSCPVGVDYIYYEIWWDSDEDGIVDTMVDKQYVYDDHVEFHFQEDCIHEIRWYAVDLLGNVETMHYQEHKVDTEGPILTKELIGTQIPDEGFTWITQDTEIHLEAVDPGYCAVDDVTIYCMYTVDDGDPIEFVYDIPFTFGEDSVHYLECWAEDALGNVGNVIEEIDKVDSTAPVTTKTFDGITFDSDYWLRQDTWICLDAEDGGDICHIGVYETYYRYRVDETTWTDWIIYDDCFQFDEDSMHEIEFYSEDLLGNEETVTYQVHEVDTVPPTIVKWVNDEGYHQSGEDITVCANITDLKGTLDPEVFEPGVGVNPETVMAYFEGENPLDPIELERIGLTDTYCATFQLYECGEWEVFVEAEDWLENYAYENGATIVIDDVPPFPEVLIPHAGDWYHDGEVFSVYAPVFDFGGDELFCPPWDCPDCPASGVDYCTFYAIDYDFEGIDPEDIQNIWDLIEELIDMGYQVPVQELGTVPAVDNICSGYLQIPYESGLTDAVFLAVDAVDNAGNMYSWLALNPWLSPITMNIDNEGPQVIITDIDGLSQPVTSEDFITVKADIEEFESQPDDCMGEIYKYVEMEDRGYELVDTGMVLDGNVIGYECTIADEIPTYVDSELVESGEYQLRVVVWDNEQNTGYGTTGFIIDNDRPYMGVISPEYEGVYEDMIVPIALYLDDEHIGIDDETVLARIHEIGWFGMDFCFGGCEETGWIPLNNLGDGIYGIELDLTDYGMTGDVEYNFDAIACDYLYIPSNDPSDPLGIDMEMDRNNIHCRQIRRHHAEEEEPICGDGIVNGGEECEDSGDCNVEGYCMEDCTCYYGPV
ncbi:MAG: hypothetical protein ABIJ20_03600 [Nanoarchaeota archaeon]|nr:hypothetical protein [Nanoarchaeota archaeon]MBU1444764.1 hypothetical protein [Nanoarchaeota archaeon]MBU2474893.1 hypothetical protein [Nanoarchaeota archaeon]